MFSIAKQAAATTKAEPRNKSPSSHRVKILCCALFFMLSYMFAGHVLCSKWEAVLVAGVDFNSFLLDLEPATGLNDHLK